MTRTRGSAHSVNLRFWVDHLVRSVEQELGDMDDQVENEQQRRNGFGPDGARPIDEHDRARVAGSDGASADTARYLGTTETTRFGPAKLRRTKPLLRLL